MFVIKIICLPMQEMSKAQVFLQCLLLLLCAELFHFSLADVGVAAQYRPPYLRKYPFHNQKILTLLIDQDAT